MHDLDKGGHAEFGELEAVLVDGHQDLLDLAGHLVLEETERVDGLDADGEFFALVDDDLLDLVDGQVDSGVGQSLEGEDLKFISASSD